MSETPTFQTVRRGYDPSEVEHVLRRMRDNHAAALQDSAQKTVEVNKLQSSLDAARTEAARLAEQVEGLKAEAASGKLNFAELGPRITQILTLAEEEAADLRAKAQQDAKEFGNAASFEAHKLRTAAETYAEEARSKADTDAARIIENAKREADDLIDHADREASARRGEAEAVYEQQRAAAAAAAADFEQTLASRRDRAAEEFSAQMANHERAMAVAEEKLAAAEAEAARVLEQAHAEADAERERAAAEARQTLDNARTQAERVRRDSERELSALASRRDSITEQLGNVRQMLATLGGGAVASMTGMADPAPAPSAQFGDVTAEPVANEADAAEVVEASETEPEQV